MRRRKMPCRESHVAHVVTDHSLLYTSNTDQMRLSETVEDIEVCHLGALP